MGKKQNTNAARKLAMQAIIIGAATLPYAVIIGPDEKETKTWATNNAVLSSATALPSASNTSTNSLRNKMWSSY